jgi:uncharacterized protein YbjT (DUF2867 family)
MKMRTYAITGATGNTGKPITSGLLKEGHNVRIISRDAEKARELTDLGAILYQGDSSDPELLKKAFTGADAVYAMIPFNTLAEDYFAFQMNHVKALSYALEASRVNYAVSLSSVGAHLKEGAGVVQGLQRMEEAFNAIKGLNTMHLRASYFMENTLGQVGAIKHLGAMGSPVRGDMPIAMVATRDIAAMALERLLKLDFSGNIYKYVLGARDVTYNELASVFGRVIGKPDLKYYTVSYEDGASAMMQMGMGKSVVGKLMEFVRSLNEGRVMEDAVRTGENTTPTTIEEFAHVFKAVYDI